MLRVTVELVPGGLEAAARVLGTLLIVNDGTGTPARGNYVLETYRPGRAVTAVDHRGRGRAPVRVWHLRGWPRRRRPVLDLVARALRELGYGRDEGGAG